MIVVATEITEELNREILDVLDDLDGISRKVFVRQAIKEKLARLRGQNKSDLQDL